MPRRRRRQRNISPSNLQDQQLIEEQQRILQSLYPSFADDASSPTTESPPTLDSPSSSPMMTRDQNLGEQEQEDVDLSMIAEDSFSSSQNSASSTPRRPQTSRMTTNDTVTSINPFETSISTSTNPANLDLFGKWAPPHPRTSVQQIRYVRRCMPLLFEETPRHSSVMVYNGKYIRPNYKNDRLDSWSLSPPSYDAHKFQEIIQPLTRQTTRSSSGSRPSISGSSQNQSQLESGMEIQRADTPAQDSIQVASLEKSNTLQQKLGDVKLIASRPSTRSAHGGGRPRGMTGPPPEMEANLMLVGF